MEKHSGYNSLNTPEAGFIKSKGDFMFQVNEAGHISTLSPPSFSGKGYDIFLDGIIYNKNKDSLIEGINESGTNFFKQIDGMFVLFFIYNNVLHVVTDRLGSKKVFKLSSSSNTIVSNSLSKLPIQECSLSIEGLATYLSNGVMLNHLTLFQEVKSLERGAVYSFTSNAPLLSKYWDISYKSSTEPSINTETLQNKLSEALINSVRSRINTIENTPMLSLSAGFDARSLLGVISKFTNQKEVHCFSYSDKIPPHPNSDAPLARELAQLAGFDHTTMLSKKSDYLSYLQNNARLSKGVSFICDEIDVWLEISKSSTPKDIFVADVLFGTADRPLNTKQDILFSAGINGKNGLTGLRKHAHEEVFELLAQSLDDLNQSVYHKVDHFQHPVDKLNYLYLDQRMQHTLLQVRSHLSEQLGYFHNPFLSNEILDFVTTLRPEQRKGKAFFKEFVTKFLPDFFTTPLATYWNYFIDHRSQIEENNEELLFRINNTVCSLDKLIPKSVLIGLIEDIKKVNLSLPKHFVEKVHRYLRRKHSLLNVLFERLGVPLTPKGGFHVPGELLFVRLFMLREFLIQQGIK